jgi:hypothetical protein
MSSNKGITFQVCGLQRTVLKKEAEVPWGRPTLSIPYQSTPRRLSDIASVCKLQVVGQYINYLSFSLWIVERLIWLVGVLSDCFVGEVVVCAKRGILSFIWNISNYFFWDNNEGLAHISLTIIDRKFLSFWVRNPVYKNKYKSKIKTKKTETDTSTTEPDTSICWSKLIWLTLTSHSAWFFRVVRYTNPVLCDYFLYQFSRILT